MRRRLFSFKNILYLAALSQASFFDMKKSLLAVTDCEPSFSQSGEKMILPWDFQAESSAINLFPQRTDFYITPVNQQQFRKKMIRKYVFNDLAANDLGSRLDLRLDISQSDIVQVDNQLPEGKRLRPTSLTLEHGLKRPDFGSSASSKELKLEKNYINSRTYNFFKDYEKITSAPSDKKLKTEKWIPDQTPKDHNIDESLWENSKSVSKAYESASESKLFDKPQDKSINVGNEKQPIDSEILEKESKTVIASIERFSTNDIFHAIKDQQINNGASSSKKIPSENSSTLSLPKPFKESYSEAMTLARSLFHDQHQIPKWLESIKFRLKVLPRDYGRDMSPYTLVTLEMGFQMGTTRQSLFEAWEEIIGKENLDKTTLDYQTKISSSNPFMEERVF
ncbi:hypothetical protein PPACK8108_LOCUS8778 [Phakopsora pachyrhizi]|uniref:Uncharacterized protein n=1 Tax=Phakopsora pachyrhizi TaxID=170000 RepID=A0AAV0AYL6_PHAPC|nr:hypothetical protein PPACK8108_LOCUS8778 [Phakopsora pachyrhizi]